MSLTKGFPCGNADEESKLIWLPDASSIVHPCVLLSPAVMLGSTSPGQGAAPCDDGDIMPAPISCSCRLGSMLLINGTLPLFLLLWLVLDCDPWWVLDGDPLESYSVWTENESSCPCNGGTRSSVSPWGSCLISCLIRTGGGAFDSEGEGRFSPATCPDRRSLLMDTFWWLECCLLGSGTGGGAFDSEGEGRFSPATCPDRRSLLMDTFWWLECCLLGSAGLSIFSDFINTTGSSSISSISSSSLIRPSALFSNFSLRWTRNTSLLSKVIPISPSIFNWSWYARPLRHSMDTVSERRLRTCSWSAFILPHKTICKKNFESFKNSLHFSQHTL